MSQTRKCLFNEIIRRTHSLGDAAHFSGNYSTCGGDETSCEQLLKNTTDYPQTKDVSTKLEYKLLQYGCFDVTPFNVSSYTVCENHLQPIDTRHFSSCSICQPVFGRNKKGASEIRPVNKLDALLIWKLKKISKFGQPICNTCRKELRQDKITEDIEKENLLLFQWLYDSAIVHTPSTSPMSSQQSHLSDTILDAISKDTRKTLKKFLLDSGFNNTVQTTENYNERSYKSKQNFVRSVKGVLKHVLGILAPNDVEETWNDICQSEKERAKLPTDGDFSVIMKAVAESYENADHYSTKRQILSVVAKDVPFSVVQHYLPDITHYKYGKAREQADYNGKGTLVDISREPTIRYTEEQVDHFMQFVISPHVSTDLPFGHRTLKLSSGEELQVPDQIRNLIPSCIIKQYLSFCAEMCPAFKPLGVSSLYSMLCACAASTRKCLQGLDYFTADGATSFDVLMEMASELQQYGLSASDASSIKKNLHQSKNYLKNEYKGNCQRHSSIPDHCSTFALSDPEEDCWSENCNHRHDDICEKCELLKDTLLTLDTAIKNLTSAKVQERLVYRKEYHVRRIESWKAHLLRLVHQDVSRSEILVGMNEETVYLYMDWAMKWLPLAYREAQRDFFAKRGMSWHIAYAIRKVSATTTPSSQAPSFFYEHKTYVHVFDQCTQNGRTVVSILQDILQRIKKEIPIIKYAHIRADNAGCFHGSETLLAARILHQNTSIWIKSVDFCDPQGGKGPCDRQAAVIKMMIRTFINEKNDVTNAIQFCNGAARASGVEVYACNIKHLDQSRKIEWKGISILFNIEYDEKNDLIRAWRSWQIGEGYELKWTDITSVTSITPLTTDFTPNIKVDWMSDKSKKVTLPTAESESESEEEEEEETDDNAMDFQDSQELEQEPESRQRIFYCDDSSCVRRYRTYGRWLNHIGTGPHKYKPDKLSLLDRSKVAYKEALVQVHHQPLPSLPFKVISSTSKKSTAPPLQQNWAALTRKTAKPFSTKQNKFLTEKFEEGITGYKWDPKAVSIQMEVQTDIDGNQYFNSDEWLSETQIKGFFGRLAGKRRKQNSSLSQSQSQSSVTTKRSSKDISKKEKPEENDDESQSDEEELIDEDLGFVSQVLTKFKADSQSSQLTQLSQTTTAASNTNNRPIRKK